MLSLFSASNFVELGGEVWVGQINDTISSDENLRSNPRVFKFQGYFGINPVNPIQNYAYFRQSGANMTVEKFCEAFDISLPAGTPQPLRESGFYGEQVFSYTGNPNGKLWVGSF